MATNCHGGYRSACLVVTSAMILTAGGGCGRAPAPQAAPAAAAGFRVSPTDLFSGELKRLEPHLGLTSGAVRIESDGSEVFVGYEAEVWENGQAVRQLGSSRVRITGLNEASFSVREVIDAKGEKQFRVVMAVSGKSGSSSTTATVQQPQWDGGALSGAVGLSGPRELAEGETVAVWAYRVHPDVGPFEGRSLEETIRKAPWVLVVKVRWERTDEQ